MAKKLIQKYSPTPEKIRSIKGLGYFAKWLGKPNLWQINRHNTAKAFAVGLFWMSIPVPSQMILAAVTAMIVRANLPLSVALVWISNPLTMPPIFYFNYVVGTYVLGLHTEASLHFEMSWSWILDTLGDLWQPLFLGSFVVGTVLAITSYVGLHLFWRFNVMKRWQNRKLTRNKTS